MMNQRPKILMIGTDMTSKGGVSSVIRLYEEAGLLQKIRFMASYTDGSASRKILHYMGFLLQYFWTLLTQSSIKLVHVHMASQGSFYRKSLVVLLAKVFGKKAVVHMHGAGFNVFYQKVPAPLKAYIRTVLRACEVLIALSSQWKTDLHRISGHTDIRVLYNPTVLRHPLFDDGPSADAGEEMPVKFLFMGRLGQRKGVYDIIESARKIQSKLVQIDLYGDGEIQEVQSAVTATGVSDKVKVCGWIDGSQKDETFRKANVLLLPSYHEGLPISVLEAMAYGLPVVATDVGGISEAVQDGVNGYLIQPGECEKLASRIEELAASPALRLQMGKSSYELAAGKFALPVIVRQLENLYEELIGR